MKPNTHKKQSGSALVLVMSILLILMVIIGVAAEYTTTVNRHVQRSNTLTGAVAIADGVIENMFARWRAQCREQSGPPTTSELSALDLPTQAQFPGVEPTSAEAPFAVRDNLAGAIVSQCRVVAVDPELNPLQDGPDLDASPDNEAVIPSIGQDPGNLTFNYVASASVTLQTATGPVTTNVRRVFQQEQISPWNYAIFYMDPLEIHPGAIQNIGGWVHTNSTLYTASDKLNFENKVTYGNDWSVGWHPKDPRFKQQAYSPTYPTNLPPARDGQKEPFGLDSGNIFNPDPKEAPLNKNNDGWRELIEPPVAGHPDPLDEQRYHAQASVRIEISDSPAPNTVTITNKNGVILPGSPSDPDYVTNNELYAMFAGAISTGNTIQDNREAALVRLVTLDIGQIIDSTTGKYKVPGFKPIIYITDTSAGAGANRGIRLKGGRSIPKGGLTVASANPVYIQGDFNTGSNPPSNTGDPTKPQGKTTMPQGTTPPGGDYTRQPCAVLGDAVNILSNAWDDNFAANLSARVASHTTVNAAIVSGIVPTGTNGAYSGGAENFPRFLESWSNKRFTYYGSMVQLYNSQQAIGNWRNTGTDVYNAPLRRWYFDRNFKTNPPPGALVIYNYVKGRWSLAN